ncbi:MAG: hypothetical protein BIFFINMI_03672 [Phycisphaerae bacterium]|nr:hypothetical protein [Phycisphaerae bacterium]
MLRCLIAGVLGAVVAFAWSWFSYEVLTWHNMTLWELPRHAEFQAELIRQFPPKSNDEIYEPGVYMFPYRDKAKSEDWQKAYASSPAGLLFVYPSGGPPITHRTHVKFGLGCLACALLAAVLLSLASGSLPGYFQRVFFVMVLALFAAVAAYLPLWDYLFHPAPYVLAMVTDLIAAWLLAGLVMAAVIGPRAKPSAQPEAKPAA